VSLTPIYSYFYPEHTYGTGQTSYIPTHFIYTGYSRLYHPARLLTTMTISQGDIEAEVFMGQY